MWENMIQHPWFFTALTVGVYAVIDKINERLGRPVYLNTILVAVIVISLGLLFFDIPFDAYYHGTRVIDLLLGPATVALAIPLYKHLGYIRRHFTLLLVAICTGSITAVGSAVLLAYATNLPHETIMSVAPKSVTTPIAMALSDMLGGNTSLTAVSVIITGIIGVVFATPIFRLLQIDNQKSQGLALGVACHGIGTGYALTLSETTGAFAALAMASNGVITAFLLPSVMQFLF